jgi:predicted dehydrogenase
VFVEKPLAETLSSAKKMVSLGDEKGIIHATGFNLAHISLYREAKRLLEKSVLGAIHRFHISVYFTQVLSKKKGWFYDKSKSGGGVVIDIASHLIYLVTWYFGLPQKVYARTLNFFSDVEDCGSIMFEYENGLVGALDANWSLPGYRLATIEIALEGENGFMEITNDFIKCNLRQPVDDLGEGWTTLHKIDMASRSHFDLGAEGFFDEDKHFVECCLSREMPLVSWKDGLDVQRIIEAVYLSSETRSPVDIDSFF